MSAATAPITHAPPILWAAARALISTIFALFGEPARIAAQHTHRQSERTLLLKWLRAGEALMRHLLLIEAASYAKPNTRPLLRAPRKRMRRLRGFTADNPGDWRVSFRCFSTLPGRSAQRGEPGPIVQRTAADEWAPDRRVRAHAGPGSVKAEDRWHQDSWPKPKFYSAWPLAERAEALLRVFNAPEAYARRLAARLHATPHRGAELVRRPDALTHVIAESDFTALREHTASARRRFDSG